jgi:predicted aminopeptidase
MDVLRYLLICFIVGFLLAGCQLSYLAKGGYYQAKMLSRQEDIETVVAREETKKTIKSKLILAREVISFIQSDLGLQTKGNYSSFVQLDGPYVTYAVTAAEKYKLEPYLWSFPIVGSVPYKGYFVRADAESEAEELKKKGYDTLVRGVSAYSSLGLIRDPILSSMLNYRDEDFVNLLIHESVHANLYIKSAADFNEQLATFLGDKGTIAFFNSRAEKRQAALQYIADSSADEKLFSAFLTDELKELEKFYSDSANNNESSKIKRIAQIQEKFNKEISGRLKTSMYKHFATEELNNAALVSYKTYLMDLTVYEKVFAKFKSNFKEFFQYCKLLEKAEDPLKDFKSKLDLLQAGH